MDDKNIEPIKAEVILYQDQDRNVPVEVRYMNETFWLTQKEIGDLFSVDRTVITKHLKNIFDSDELDQESTCAKIAHIGSSGRMYETTLYNLDAIIAVGYRVNSKQATKFRKWATNTLKEYIVKGFVLNDDMLKNGAPFGKDYFDELLVRIRDIRASERRFYQKITDIFQQCSFDYDKNSDTARIFYANVQNKLHFAVTGKTAAELICDRADASKVNMGLTTWKGSPDGPIHSNDVTVAKNYLSEEELSTLNRFVSMFIDVAELSAQDHVLMSMKDCSDMLDEFLRFNRRSVLNGAGKRSRKQAEAKAKSEFEKYRKIQDQNYLNDFEKHLGRWQKPTK